MSKVYKTCPMCGSLCTIEGDDKEGTHYYQPVCKENLQAQPVVKGNLSVQFSREIEEIKYLVEKKINYTGGSTPILDAILAKCDKILKDGAEKCE